MAGNRDEFHARPTAALAPWQDETSVIGGRDLRSGGGWAAVDRTGRLAVVTNVVPYVIALSALTRERGVEFNLEGNPFAGPRPGYPGFLLAVHLTKSCSSTVT